jgi:hypothetical protein
MILRLMCAQHPARVIALPTGLPFIFVNITTMSYVGVPRKENNQVSGLSNLSKNIGGSILTH